MKVPMVYAVAVTDISHLRCFENDAVRVEVSENRGNEGEGVNIVHILILLTKKLSRLSAFILFDMGYTNSM